MQRLYNLTLYSALIICAVLVLVFVGSIFLPTAIDSDVIVLPQVSVLAFFLLISLAFYFLDGNRQLRLPSFLSEKKVNVSLKVEFILFLILFAGGLHGYPNAPIRSEKSSYVDKAGKKYTYQQFNNFKKWETAYLLLGSVFALQLIVLSPFYDKQTKKWEFES